MKPKRYNPDPQSFDDDLPEPENNPDDFEEPGEDNWKEELIEERGIEADDYNFY